MDRCAEPDCGSEIPARESRCPHCGRPGLFPNVRAASQPEERAALGERYARAREDVEVRGCAGIADAFERAIGRARAVVARPLSEVERLTRDDRQVYSTYYRQIEAEVRLPDDPRWDVARRLAEEALFPGYKEDIRFAALTLDDHGLPSYGECFFTLRPSMTAHRTTLFEENVVLFMEARDLKLSELERLPRGFRATWSEGARLCLAKIGTALRPTTTEADFAGLLLRAGATTSADELVEAHIWGPITARAIEKIVLVRPARSRTDRVKQLAWREKLRREYDVDLEVL